MRSICVYCSSSDAIDPLYFEAARELGAAIARDFGTLVYGGTNIGLMGAVARAVHAGDPRGKVVAVVPEVIYGRGLVYEAADELIVTRDLRLRKHEMQARSDAFVALPGGIGTWEEILEMLTLKQLDIHTKPIVFLNVAGYYGPLTALLEHAIAQRFMKQSSRELYHAAEDVCDAVEYLKRYEPPRVEAKWAEAAET
ncbi:MAG: TIGR00730 family Rossman fold protein [Acidobacteriaceae bacterium]